MRHLASFAVTAAALLGAASPALAQTGDAPQRSSSSPARATLCQPGPDEPRNSELLRPGRTATCPYNANELEQKIIHLIEHAATTREQAASLALQFGLPALTTSYDATRIADYSMGIRGANGLKARLWIKEAAFPLDDALPPAFEPGLFPERLLPIEKLDVSIWLTLFPDAGDGQPGTCITAAPLAEAAKAAGWEDETSISQMYVTDGGAGYPLFHGADGRILTMRLQHQKNGLPTAEEMATSCLLEVHIALPPEGQERLEGPHIPRP